ncbi:MAG: EF-hand domain-containing protein, partial [Candidatus Eisenbacteria bacterium]|nr:EF-hand domain-containing protein [Candidatus Eisenbacteria bacterium]
PEQMFQKLDADSDGKVSAAELDSIAGGAPQGAPSAADVIGQFDTDGDGGLSLDEMTAMHDQHRAQMEAIRTSKAQEGRDLLSLLESKDSTSSSGQWLSEILSQYLGSNAAGVNKSSVDLIG